MRGGGGGGGDYFFKSDITCAPPFLAIKKFQSPFDGGGVSNGD